MSSGLMAGDGLDIGVDATRRELGFCCAIRAAQPGEGATPRSGRR